MNNATKKEQLTRLLKEYDKPKIDYQNYLTDTLLASGDLFPPESGGEYKW